MSANENEIERKVTQSDVAREAGVTRSMVSYVISGNTERSVAPETRKKILEVIERLGYRPNKAAQVLQQGKEAYAHKHIGVVLCNAEVFRRPFYAEILAGIHTAAHENTYQVRFIRFFEELKNPVLFNELIHSEEIGGLILVSTDQCLKTPEDYAVIEKIKQRISRIVCVEWKCDGLSSVLFDRQDTAKKAADYLFNKGYDDIIYIGESDDRILGVQRSFFEHKKDITKLVAEPCFNMSGGYEVIKKINENGSLPRAVVCGSDEVAIGVLRYLNKMQIAVPQKVAVISIDDIENSAYTNPPLTTMAVQKAGMGARAVELIVNNNAGKNENALNIMLPTCIVERESC